MTTILPVASGKGGVGKSLFVANLGITLGRLGKTVLLIDLDLGGSNLHTFLGVSNRHPGIGNYIYKETSTLESLIMPTDYDKVYFISGDSMIPGTANLNYFTKRKIIKQMKQLVADYILIDLGAGSAYNTLDFFLVTTKGLLVTVPETTAILNTYGFLKSALFRLLYRSFPKGSDERGVIIDFISSKIEGTDRSFAELLNLINHINEESGRYAASQLQSLFPRVVLNMCRSPQDKALGSKLREIVGKNLALSLEYIGFIENEEIVRRSIFERKPSVVIHPRTNFAQNLDHIARKLINEPVPKEVRLYEADEDLESLIPEEEGYVPVIMDKISERLEPGP